MLKEKLIKIYNIIKDADVLLGLAPEELAFSLLEIANRNLQSGLVHRNVIISLDYDITDEGPRPFGHKIREVEVALIEALHWLEVNAFLLPAPGINGNNGFRILGRRAREIVTRQKFDNFKRAASFSKSLLHPAIADRVWIALARGELADAVFIAFRSVEEEVRLAGRYQDTDIGVVLMRNAFSPKKGPLSDTSKPVAEQEALMNLFAGAIGSYKNPHSHRTVTITDHAEAQEIVLLASHLLRIVDSRRPK